MPKLPSDQIKYCLGYLNNPKTNKYKQRYAFELLEFFLEDDQIGHSAIQAMKEFSQRFPEFKTRYERCNYLESVYFDKWDRNKYGLSTRDF